MFNGSHPTITSLAKRKEKDDVKKKMKSHKGRLYTSRIVSTPNFVWVKNKK